MKPKPVLATMIVGIGMMPWWSFIGAAVGMPLTVQVEEDAVRVDITINARQFHPSPVSLPVGRQVVLVFHNQDVELHAFVPERFLEHVPVHIDGNGAPQFGEKGLERVLIPSGGTEEIRFRPTLVGEFKYRCDLPGHQMVGKIVVEVRQTGQHTAVERRTGVQATP
jgi:plastocyanin